MTGIINISKFDAMNLLEHVSNTSCRTQKTCTKIFILAVILLASSAIADSFTDTHDDGMLTNWDVVGSRTWSESAGVALPQDGSGATGFLVRHGLPSNDGDLEVDLHADQWNGQRGGVVFRYTSPTSFYYIGVRPANEYEPHIYFCKDAVDNCMSLGEKWFRLNSDVTLKVSIRGGVFKVYLNGDSAAIISDGFHATGRVGYAHSGEWNRLCSFESMRWTEVAAPSSSLLSSSSYIASSSSSSVQSSSSVIVSSSSQQGTSMPVVTTKVIGYSKNWYSVAITLRNLGEAPLNNPVLGWHYIWADHSATTDPEIDYASVTGTTLNTEDRDDFSGTVWLTVPKTLAKNDSAIVHLRLHTADYTPIDHSNDLSWKGVTTDGGINNAITVRVGGQDLLYEVPRLPFPTTAKQSASVQTIITNSTTNSLWLKCYITNTGEVPLRKVRFTYYTDTLASEQPMQMDVDWSQVAGTTVSKSVLTGGEVAFDVKLGDVMLPIGATMEVQLRLHSASWGNISFNDDWSYPVSFNATNPNVTLTSDGLQLTGLAPGRNDSDNDGVTDDVELLYGTDPNNAGSVPIAGIPDRTIVDNAENQYVLYDFSRIPGYASRTKIAVPVSMGTLADGKPPRIRWNGALSTLPTIPDPKTIAIGGVFHIEATPTVGSLVSAAIPFPDRYPKTLSSEDYDAYRFDVQTQEWQAAQQLNGYDGAVHFSTPKFSDWEGVIHTQVNRISGSGDHVLVIDSLGAGNRLVLSMGRNDKGQLGLLDIGSPKMDMLRSIAGLGDVRSISAGQLHSLALTMDGRVLAWGDNTHGQLGNGTIGGYSSTPVLVPLPDGYQAKEVVAGYDHSFVITTDERIYAWGKGTEGQLGIIDSVNGVDTLLLMDISTPRALRLPNSSGSGWDTLRVLEVVAGDHHSVARDTNENIWVWGANDMLQQLVQSEPCSASYMHNQKSDGTTIIGWVVPVCNYVADSKYYRPTMRSLIGFQGLVPFDRVGYNNRPSLAAGKDNALSWQLALFSTSSDMVYPSGLLWGDASSIGIPLYNSPIITGQENVRFSLSADHVVHLQNTSTDPLLVLYGSNAKGQLATSNSYATRLDLSVPNAVDATAGNGWTGLMSIDPAATAASESRSFQFWGTMNGTALAGSTVGKSTVNPVVVLDSIPTTINTSSLRIRGHVVDPKGSALTVQRLVILSDGVVKLDKTISSGLEAFDEMVSIDAGSDGSSHSVQVQVLCGPTSVWGSALATVRYYVPLTLLNVSASAARLIYPNGSQTVSFNLSKAASYTVSFWENDAVKTVQKVFNVDASESGTQTVVWNGRKDDNSHAPSGIYGITIIATDAFGYTNTFSSLTEPHNTQNAIQYFPYSEGSRYFTYIHYTPATRLRVKLAMVSLVTGTPLSDVVENIFDSSSAGEFLSWKAETDATTWPTLIEAESAGTYFSIGWSRPSFTLSRTNVSISDMDLIDVTIDETNGLNHSVTLLDAANNTLCVMNKSANTGSIGHYSCIPSLAPRNSGAGELLIHTLSESVPVDSIRVPFSIQGDQ